jgi:hypothetical protein
VNFGNGVFFNLVEDETEIFVLCSGGFSVGRV